MSAMPAWYADSACRFSESLALVLLLATSTLSATPPNDGLRKDACGGILSRLFRPSRGGEYRLIVAEGESRIVGNGRLNEDGREGAIDFIFDARLPGRPAVQGRVRILQPKGRGCNLHLLWEQSGATYADLPGHLDETVKADADLAGRGILQFYFDGGRRFFQLDRKDRKSRLVLDTGLLVLQPVP